MPKPLHPALTRFRNASVTFAGKFQPADRKRLAAIVEAHGGTVAANLDGKTTHLVLSDKASGTAQQTKATSLRKKGSAIEVLEVAAFRKLFGPTEAELLAILKDGMRGVRALAGVAPAVSEARNYHGAIPDAPRIVGARFDKLDLSDFDLRGLAFEKCSFVGAKLNNTLIAEAVECDFSKAIGDKPHFEKINCSRFVDAQFTEAEIRSHIEGSDFTGAAFENSLFSGTFWAAGVISRPSKEVPSFERARLHGCAFEHFRCDGANFDRADLTGASFSSCCLESASFRGTKVHDSLLVAVDLPNSDFSNASLVGSNLAEADLSGAKLDGADMTNVNLRETKIDPSALKKLNGVTPDSTRIGAVGPALTELDSILNGVKKVVITFRVGNDSVKRNHELQITSYSRNSFLWLPDLRRKVSPRGTKSNLFSQELLKAARVFAHLPVRFETVVVKNAGASKKGKALRDLMIQGIAEAFAQPAPSELDTVGAAAHREAQQKKIAEQRERRAAAKAQAEKQKAKAKKQIAKKIEKAVGKVSDVASFLKALELRIEKPKIDKATKMLKASGFKLFNDVTDEYVSGVVKSQADPDLVYACRVSHDGGYSCCTQNLNVCGGLRGSLCKHQLVLIIGLVQAGELDPTTIDGWVAKTHSTKPELDKETMGAIFIKYKGAEAGEVDWRPTETVPEDYYAL